MKFFLALVSSLFLSKSQARLRELQTECILPGTIPLTVASCDYETIKVAIQGEFPNCSDDDVLLHVGSAEAVDDNCAEAYSDSTSLPFSEVLNKGYQYDREFFNGGTDLNSFESSTVNHEEDTKRLAAISTELLGDTIIEWPEYLSNFEGCYSQAAMCCWTADKYDVPNIDDDGSCTTPGGCADGNPLDNTDVCHVDMERSPLAARTYEGSAVYLGDSEGPVNCQGFAWDNKDGVFKGNALFHVAMQKGLLGNGYTRNVPGAPMCGCVETMPVVSNAGCTNTVVSLDVTLIKDVELSILLGNKSITFGECDGEDLAVHYASRFAGETLEKYVVGDCSSGYGVERSIKLMGYVQK